MEIESLIREKKGTIIDVRSEAEYSLGHAENAINIPLQQLPDKTEQLKKLQEPFILCCASGGRSAQANVYLSLQGFNTVNAGSWLDVLHFQSLEKE